MQNIIVMYAFYVLCFIFPKDIFVKKKSANRKIRMPSYKKKQPIGKFGCKDIKEKNQPIGKFGCQYLKEKIIPCEN